MKKFLVLLAGFITSASLFAQYVPNGDFENWENMKPVGWTISGGVTQYTPSPGTVLGASSVRLNNGIIVSTFACKYRPVSLRFYKGFGQAAAADAAIISIMLFKTNQGIKDTIANSSFIINTNDLSGSTISISAIAADISYKNSNTPDSCKITVFSAINTSTSGVGDPNTTLLLDNITLNNFKAGTYETKIGTIDLGSTLSPNPSTGAAHITFNNISKDNISVVLFDITGKELATLFNGTMPIGEQKINCDFGNLNSGIYFYKIKSGILNETKKFVVNK